MAIDPGKRAQRALRVVRSTTAELLCEELAQRLSTRWAGEVDGLARIGPFDRVVVAVQGKGLERWMRRRLAHRLGAVGGIETPYLRRFLFDIAGMVTGETLPSRDRDDVLELAYRVAQEIADRCGTGEGHGPRRDASDRRDTPAQLEGGRVPRVDAAHVRPLVTGPDGSGAHPHALLSAGHRLAAIFDALEVERPELVAAWREGRALPERAPWLKRDAADHPRLASLCGWMHRLWWWTAGPGGERDSAATCWSGHRAWQSVRDAISILSGDGSWGQALSRIGSLQAADDRARMPAMVSVFGVSSLPPLALDFLAALGSRIDVTLHLVTPTDQYMDESIMGRPGDGEPDEAHLDSLWSRGHRLLAVCARQPMSMQQRLLSLAHVEDVECVSRSPHAAAAAACDAAADGGHGREFPSALRALQRSLREGVPMERAHAADGSVSVHLVSGATRAGEVLRDQVLDAFASLPGTGPDDVLVLTTDVERYGTAIARALGAATPRPIPVTIADRSARVERAAVRTFCDALQVLDGELTLEDLGTVVASAPVAGRAGVSVEECVQCLEHLHAVGARRFIDAEHRRRVLSAAGGAALAASAAGAGPGAAARGAGHDRSDAPDGTFMDAADRLAISIAVSQDVGGTQLPGLARVCATIDSLVSLGRRTSESRTALEWCEWSRDLLDAIVQRRSRSSDEGDLPAQRAAILEAVESVAAAASQAGLSEPMPFAVARGEIMDAIDRSAIGRRFGASGGVMVGGLVPMRSVPSRIVALVGLDRGVFPRRDERSGIDPRRWSRGVGDRSARDEDRALFLEAIHAAADRLIVISTAVDAASGEAEPASPLVDILLEQCGAAARVTRHGVHGFSEEEWSAASADRPRRDGHARRCAVARRIGAGPDARRRVLCEQVRSPVNVGDALLARVDSVDRIVECMRDPARWWLEAMGARITSMESDADEREPGAIDRRAQWVLEQALIEQVLRGTPVSVDAVVDAQRRVGALPAGAAAESVGSELQAWLGDEVMSSVGYPSCPAAPHEWVVDGSGGPLAARGWRSAGDPGTQVLARGGSWSARRAVEIAVRAAAWAAAGGARTVVIPDPEARSGMPAEIVWSGTPDDAARALHAMRAIAAAGMVVPLCFHPMLLAGADIAGLAAGSEEARAPVIRTLEEWLSRSVDDLSRGEVDARAMRTALRGMSAREVLDGPRADAVEPPPEMGGAPLGSGAPSVVAAVRTDFGGVWPAVEALLSSCGWARSAAGAAP